VEGSVVCEVDVENVQEVNEAKEVKEVKEVKDWRRAEEVVA
jgi:hypothetical protein